MNKAVNPEAMLYGGNSSTEEEWKHRIHQELMRVIDLSLIGTLGDREARSQIRETCQSLMVEMSAPLNIEARQRIIKQIEDEILGLGPLEPILADPQVADILVNGHDQIYIERGGRLQLTGARFHSDRHLLNIIDRIVSSIGRRVDESSPMVDARLQDGSRVNAIIPPLAIDGPSLSIRRFSVGKLTMEEMVAKGSLSPAIGRFLDAVVKGRLNVVISGGTGSGKTTMLNVMSGFVPATERIITIEDSAELQLQQPHTVRLETRPPNIEGKGEISQRDLVKNSLRMRPDRIILGEIRGSEALDVLQAMNTGHDGSMTTIHANSARDALTRLESMVSMSGVSIPIGPLRGQIASAVDVVLQLERQSDGGRRLVSIQEINGMEGDVITMSELFRFRRRGVDDAGRVMGAFEPTGVVPRFYEELNAKGVALDIALFNGDSFDE